MPDTVLKFIPATGAAPSNHPAFCGHAPAQTPLFDDGASGFALLAAAAFYLSGGSSQSGGAYSYWNSATSAGLNALNAEITRQASIVACMDDFKLMLIVTLPAMLLLLLLRRPGSRGDTEQLVVVD